ncbi:MAG: BMP family ABC transporter substrate-binding protein [Anaerolineales bacterium]|nr:BMP family ABC transporter substrate-binding protein [Anaerolineales bacterium]
MAGALAALLSENNKVAYLGGADVLVIRRIQFGFEQGVKYVKPDAEIVVKYVAGKDDFSGFSKPDEANAIAAQLYADGVDLIMRGGRVLSARSMPQKQQAGSSLRPEAINGISLTKLWSPVAPRI